MLKLCGWMMKMLLATMLFVGGDALIAQKALESGPKYEPGQKYEADPKNFQKDLTANIEAWKGARPGSTQEYITEQQNDFQRTMQNKAFGLPNSDFEAFEQDLRKQRQQQKINDQTNEFAGAMKQLFDGYNSPIGGAQAAIAAQQASRAAQQASKPQTPSYWR